MSQILSPSHFILNKQILYINSEKKPQIPWLKKKVSYFIRTSCIPILGYL